MIRRNRKGVRRRGVVERDENDDEEVLGLKKMRRIENTMRGKMRMMRRKMRMIRRKMRMVRRKMRMMRRRRRARRGG